MPQFAYRAKDSHLKIIEGTIEADSEAAAISRLGGQGVFPITIAEAGAPAAGTRLWRDRRVSKQTLAFTTRQLADLLSGGLPLLSALTLLGKQTEHAGLRRMVEQLAAAVREGRPLSDAMSEHPRVFPPLYVSMVRAGEVGGALEQSLDRLATLWEQDAELIGRVKSAAAYPLFVLVMAAAMTAFLMAYVIPTLSQVFTESGQALPLPTRIVLAISGALRAWWWLLLGAAIALGAAARQWAASPAGRATLDRVFLRLPGIGTLARKIETARFSRSLGVLIGQGVPLLSALEVVARNITNTLLREAILRVQARVREGSSIAAALGATNQFPVFVSNMVAVGEESGSVDAALLKVAIAYERDVDRTIRTLTTLLEPILLVVVGGVVMFIVLAMLLPIFQLGSVVQ